MAMGNRSNMQEDIFARRVKYAKETFLKERDFCTRVKKIKENKRKKITDRG